MYDELVRMSQQGEVDFSHATVFNLDEFYSLPPEHPASFASYLRVHFLDRLPIGRVVLLDGLAPDPEEECARIEDEIYRAGGLDLAILGLGQNGHIAFNEPGSTGDSPSRLVCLTETSRWANKAAFPSYEDVPYTALTMGVATIMAARAVLLLAAGPHKACVLAHSLCEPPTADLPASCLQRHPRLTVIADRLASTAVKGDSVRG